MPRRWLGDAGWVREGCEGIVEECGEYGALRVSWGMVLVNGVCPRLVGRKRWCGCPSPQLASYGT